MLGARPAQCLRCVERVQVEHGTHRRQHDRLDVRSRGQLPFESCDTMDLWTVSAGCLYHCASGVPSRQVFAELTGGHKEAQSPTVRVGDSLKVDVHAPWSGRAPPFNLQA